MRLSWSTFLVLLPFVKPHVSDGDDYREKLDLWPLSDGKLNAAFRFTIRANLDNDYWGGSVKVSRSRLFSRSVASIIKTHSVAEFHLSLAAGRWEYDRWGQPSSNGSAPGAEIWAWLRDREDQTIEQQWSAFANSIGGLFCASLNRLDHSRTTSPSFSFRPVGQTSPQMTHISLRRGILPLEKPCTENLTPVLALLPCRSSAGLAQLLNPHRFLNSHWQKIGISYTAQSQAVVELRLDLEIVFDPVRLDKIRGGPGRRDWSFEVLFDRKLTRPCPPASESSIRLHLKEGSNTDLLDRWGWKKIAANEAALADATLPLNARLAYHTEPAFEYPASYTPAPVGISRIHAGFGQERGQIGVEISNLCDHAVDAYYTEEWPWWLKMYLHTFRTEVISGEHTEGLICSSLRYIPSRDRQRPTLIESQLHLPPKSRTRLTVEYDKALLRYTEYAPDANRGFDLPAATLQIGHLRTHTMNGLIFVPVPDFSMPYNVAVLTCTVVALVFGSIFNLLVRQFVLIRPH